MDTTQYISDAQLDVVIEAVYAAGSPVVKEAYSELDTPTRSFPSAADLMRHTQFVSGRKAFYYYALYYPDAKGWVAERRIDLNPGACPGHTHRFSQEGWGLIQLQITFRDRSRVECRIAVNSSIRAEKWFVTFPEMKSPDLWDWNVVDRHAGRLVRLLRKLGKQGGPSAAGNADKPRS